MISAPGRAQTQSRRSRLRLCLAAVLFCVSWPALPRHHWAAVAEAAAVEGVAEVSEDATTAVPEDAAAAVPAVTTPGDDTAKSSPAEVKEEEEEHGVVSGDDRSLSPIAAIHLETPFSLEWIKSLGTSEAGCSDWRTVGYPWREEEGFTSNMNNLLDTWVYAVAGRQRENLVVTDESGHLDGVLCKKESKGKETSGWPCLWSPVPHVCFIRKEEDWVHFMRSDRATEMDIQSATSLTFDNVRTSMRRNAEDWVRVFGVDRFVARQTLSRMFLWSRVQPWVKGAVRELLMSTPDEVRIGPFVSLHVANRGDTQGDRWRRPVGVEVYLSRARARLLSDSWETLERIRGIWVVSDDPGVVDEVRRLAPDYLPGVTKDSSVVLGWSHNSKNNDKGKGNKETYESVVNAMADLVQLSRGETMVGVAGNEVDEVASLLRSGIGKTRDTTISVDVY